VFDEACIGSFRASAIERSTVNLRSTIMMHYLCFTGNPAAFYNEGATTREAMQLKSKDGGFKAGIRNIFGPARLKGSELIRVITVAGLLPLPATRLGARAVMLQFINMLCCSYTTVMLNLHYSMDDLQDGENRDFLSVVAALLLCEFIEERKKASKVINFIIESPSCLFVFL